MFDPDGLELAEVYLRLWSAEARIVKAAHTLCRQHDMDPSLAYGLEDRDDWTTSLLLFLEALVEARSLE
jgi:hypothetical protein